MKIFLSYGYNSNARLIENDKRVSLKGCGKDFGHELLIETAYRTAQRHKRELSFWRNLIRIEL